MSSSDFWDSRYSEKGYAYGTEPNDFLKETWLKLQLPNKPSALLLADGEGRNSVFVAQQGAQATAVDISAVGMAKTQKLAREKGVAESVSTVVADLADYDLGRQQWDVIVSIYNHMPPPLRQKVLEAVPRALKAGGYFVLEGYTPQQLELKTGGPTGTKMTTAAFDKESRTKIDFLICIVFLCVVAVAPPMYSSQILESVLQDHLTIELNQELVRKVVEGKYHTGDGAVVQFIGKKSSESSTIIGIDLGTSNCTAAVWDSTRGHPKWMRLGSLATPGKGSKAGRIMPSVIILAKRQAGENDSVLSQWKFQTVDSRLLEGQQDVVGLVGAPAVKLIEECPSIDWTESAFDPNDIFQASISSAKRLLSVQSFSARIPLPYNQKTTQLESGEVALQVRPIGLPTSIHVNATQAMSILLSFIRSAAEDYLIRNKTKKNLQIPFNSPRIRRCVVGVPANFDQSQRQKILESVKLAGMMSDDGDLGSPTSSSSSWTLTESTGAAMAYGMFVSSALSKHNKRIMVWDMGGGTTDVTVVEKRSNEESPSTQNSDAAFQVVATCGDSSLGGDDMDHAILRLVLKKLEEQKKGAIRPNNADLLRRCKHAKELLCGDVDHGYTLPEDQTTVTVDGESIMIDQQDFQLALQPILEQSERLVEDMLTRLCKIDHFSKEQIKMDEIVLVGGATRVPAIREFLRSKFPPPNPPDLCLSVNAMAAVAQGCAVQAAIRSRAVPLHELRSAMMLDTVPHDIGVMVEETGNFVRIIPKDAVLPASGSAIFQLASPTQNGVTVNAMERVEDRNDSVDNNDSSKYVDLGTFTFILHRLTETQLAALEDQRDVEITMTLKESGEFVVAVFDENDPEQTRRRKRSKQSATGQTLRYESEGSNLTQQEIMLIGVCIMLAILYVALKLMFHEVQAAQEL